ncbi:hypothetical protein [Sulfurospirillum diekertiae]|uniref:Uncharacterized protein n=1 Tax=Sulfurospirillum diekertiae TaxID=1854492 RepID=A0A1Y0HIR7_9BACT|nr:hypothetical protein [Sulfurospirillum diekertiae]ARU47245.1 hypothetical protein Sdiek1_0057 [Sulfurospirillum diekertiae]ASC92099.1 hypothetical protein Sdiek2_0056 [Sulfurospirillum diekertiae]
MTHKEVMAKLFDFNATTYYAWKKQNRPIITLLDQYFSKEDIEEFLEFGSIEKFGFLEFIDYTYKEAAFVSILSALANLGHVFHSNIDDYIDYLAYALSYDSGYVQSLETRQEFLAIFIYAYDSYKGYFTIDDLGMAIKQIDLHFPAHNGYADVIAYFIDRDFLPFVKACIMNKPQYINLAIQFCIRFNLYKYKSTCHYEDLYQKFQMPFDNNINFTSALQIVFNQFNYEAFKNEIKAIKQDSL